MDKQAGQEPVDATAARVGVIFGGQSGEHDVSLVSARSVMNVLRQKGHQVVPIGITRRGQWLLTGDPHALLSAGGPDLPQPEDRGPETGRELVPGATGQPFPAVDVVFPVLHGPRGEDGTLQGLLELANVPYVGCGVLASSLAMDKIACKQLLMSHGIPVVPFVSFLRSEWEAAPQAILAGVEAELGYPVFVKPANLGSSIGISKASDRGALMRAVDDAGRFDRRILVERAVDKPREIECAVLGNDHPMASVPGEVIPSNEFYDYAAKYIDGSSTLQIPAQVSPAVADQIRDLALAAFRAIDGAGLARVDFLLSDTTGELYLNELNTMPGFTTISMYPKLWEATGIPYAELVEQLIDLAMARHADQVRSQTMFDGGQLTA